MQGARRVRCNADLFKGAGAARKSSDIAGRPAGPTVTATLADVVQRTASSEGEDVLITVGPRTDDLYDTGGRAASREPCAPAAVRVLPREIRRSCVVGADENQIVVRPRQQHRIVTDRIRQAGRPV